MKRPKFKKEITVRPFIEGSNLLIIEIATYRALDWLLNKGIGFTTDKFSLYKLKNENSKPALPTSIEFHVSELYDSEEVVAYLNSPSFEDCSPLKLAQERDK